MSLDNDIKTIKDIVVAFDIPNGIIKALLMNHIRNLEENIMFLTKETEYVEDMISRTEILESISTFLLERDQQTTQDERDESERFTSAFYILAKAKGKIII